MHQRIWMILAILLLIVAAVFLWQGNLSAAFVIATLGAAAWFLSYRSQLRAHIAIDKKEDDLVDEERDEN